MFFGANTSQGQLCGVSGEYAAVQAEKAMKMAETVGEPSSSDQLERNDGFRDGAVLETAIIGAAGNPFRLLTMVRSDLYRRIVDPADTIMGLHEAIVPRCKHAKDVPQKFRDTQYTIFSFDRILRKWNKDFVPRNPFETTTRQVTAIFDTALKFNVTMGLVSSGSVIHSHQCCTRCATTVFNYNDQFPGTIVRTGC